MKSFLEYLLEEKNITEANSNDLLNFTRNDLETLMLEKQNEDEDDVTSATSININKSNNIYQYLKRVTPKFADIYCIIINELWKEHENNGKFKGLFPDKQDEIAKFLSSSKATFLNLICVEADKASRDVILAEILKFYNNKIKSEKGRYYIDEIAQNKHTLIFKPNKTKKNGKYVSKIVDEFKFSAQIVLHIVQPKNDRLLNKISSDITEILPAVAAIYKNNFSGYDALKIAKFLESKKSQLCNGKNSLCNEADLNSLINGIKNNSDRQIIQDKIKHATTKLIPALFDYLKKNKLNVVYATLTNEKQKIDNDTADIKLKVVDDKNVEFMLPLSIKDDFIDGKGHALRDFSILKQLNNFSDYSKIFEVFSFEKFIKDNIQFTEANFTKKPYYRWIVEKQTEAFQKKCNANKTIFAKMLTYAFNLTSKDTKVLSWSGIHDNVTTNKNYASYKLIQANELLEKNDSNTYVNILGKNEIWTISVLNNDKKLIQFSIQVGAGKYDDIKQNQIDMAKDAIEQHIPYYVKMVLKFRDLVLKNI